MAVTAKSPNAVRAVTQFCPPPFRVALEPSRNFDRLAFLWGSKAHGRSAFQFVPGKALAFDGTLEGLEQNDRKQLPVSEPLQPNLAQQPGIFFGFGLAAFQREGKRRGQEVDDQECSKKHHQPLEAGRIGGVGMEVSLDEVPNST